MPEVDPTSDSDADPSALIEPIERIRQLSLSAAKVPFDSSVPIKRYWRSGRELLRMANVYNDEQQLDKAFILYMKYITLFVEKIPQHPEYKTSEPNERTLTKTNCKHVFPIAEQLKSLLKERYQKEYNLSIEQKKRKQLEYEMRSEQEKQEIEKRREEQKERELKDLQMRLNRQIKERQERPEMSVPDLIASDSNRIEQRVTNDLIPSIDRSTKPSAPSMDKKLSFLSRVIVPQKVIQKFLMTAQRNTNSNVETCAILAGKLGQNAFTITHVLVPKQRGTADSCQTENEEEVFMIQDDSDLLTIGWIHTHPSQNAFMSSIDLHTHCSYQLMLPEAIAIVCAPKKDEIGVFSLTSPYGLELIASCKLSGFHPHPTQPPIYEQSSHITFDTTADVELIDLR